MNPDRLREYVENELQIGKERANEISLSDDNPKNKLRILYDIPLDKKVVYAETGGLFNDTMFPDDVILIIPIFPYSERDLTSAIGPLPKLRELIDKGRVFPVIQHPMFYEECDHLSFLFDKCAPSYFIRGLFAYSAVLNLPPIVEIGEEGIPALSDIYRLQQYCSSTHKSWLNYVKNNPDCWEHRYRRYTLRDERFYKRIHGSLCYRYASVALCIGQHNADQIISVFPPSKAAEVLLHLHIMFDHVMCHGVGSDLVVHPQTPDGMDFKLSKQTGVTKPHELVIGDNLRIELPECESEYISDLLKEEHFLREVDFSIITRDSVIEIQDKLSRQFSDFQKRVESVAKGKKLIQTKVEITVYLLTVAAAIFGGPIPGTLGIIAGLKLPWLIESIANALEKFQREKLATYIIDTPRKNENP